MTLLWGECFLVMEERVACYAHAWHLPAAALYLPPLTAEPSWTLPVPASSSWWKQALNPPWQSPAERALFQGWFYPTVIAFTISGMFIICTVYFSPLISSFNHEAMPCLHVQKIPFLHLNRLLIFCLPLNMCKQIYESTSCLVLMNSLPSQLNILFMLFLVWLKSHHIMLKTFGSIS